MKYDIIATLCSNDAARRENIDKLKRRFESVITIDALDASIHDDMFCHVINHYQIPVEMIHTQKRNIGFLGCWLSFIFTLKYIYDIYDSNTPVIMIQDDLIIPEGFDFKEDTWVNRGRMYKLSQWDEMYVVDKIAAERFLTTLYRKPIGWHGQDRWIMQHMDPVYLKQLWTHRSQKQLSLMSHTNNGLIKKASSPIHKYKWNITKGFKSTDPGSLLNTKIFKHKKDIISLENTLKQT